MHKYIISSLNKTWLIDIDGTIVKHNGYLDGKEKLNDNVGDFFNKIPDDDYILILTARSKDFKEETISFLIKNNIRFNKIIFDLPKGERILINDKKPSGLKTAISINIERDKFPDTSFIIED